MDEGLFDLDGDGIPNYLDTDSDGDEKLDADEGVADDDCDGAVNYLDADDGDDLCGDSGGASAGSKTITNDGGCACSVGGTPVAQWWWLVLGAFALRRRRGSS